MSNGIDAKLGPGDYWIVFMNGTIAEVEPEDLRIFTSKELAIDYVDYELESYPDLDYYLCPVMELHHCSVTKHVRKLCVNGS